MNTQPSTIGASSLLRFINSFSAPLLLALSFLVFVTACEGFKEAMTAHVDVAAKAGSQELSVQRLAEMMGKSQVPLRKEVAQSVAEVWVNYQLLAIAAANNDSLSDPKLVDDAMWPVYTQERTRKWYEKVSASFQSDTTNMEAKFNDGALLSARHILFQVPAGQEATGSDSIRKKAEGVLARTTAANFAALAKQLAPTERRIRVAILGSFPRGRWSPSSRRPSARSSQARLASWSRHSSGIILSALLN